MNNVIDIRERRRKNLNFSGRRRRKLWKIVELLEKGTWVSQKELSLSVSGRTPRAIQGAIDELRDCGWVIRREKRKDGNWYLLVVEQAA
ncbi:MAG: hypothetical protein AAGE86_00790 [Pseudomonadota bacterium]